MKHTKQGISYSPREARIKNREDSFAKQKVTFDDTPLFFPAGFEKLFLAIYFVTLPYIAGLLFLFFYVADGKKDLFLALNDDSSFFLTWAIGYEIIAALIILWIIKSAISFSYGNHQRGKKKAFRRP
jgi:hypothetical protein